MKVASEKRKSVVIRLKIPRHWNTIAPIQEKIRGLPIEVDSIKWPIKAKSASAKGSNFERALAKELSLWWTDGEDSHVFARRGGSGGSFRDRAGLSDSSGDLTADKAIGEHFMSIYSIEAKFYADLSSQFWNLFHGERTAVLEQFWLQARNAASPYNRFVLLILKSNGKKPICVTNHDWWKDQHAFKTVLRNDSVYVFPFSNLLSINSKVFKDLTPPDRPIKITFKRSGKF